MYDSMPAIGLRTRPLATAALALAALLASTLRPAPATAQVIAGDSVIRKITAPSEKLEITTNTSRILTLEKRIPRVQVNNPDLLAVTPLSATQIQVSAKQPGVTAVNLWDEEGNIHTVDVFIYGDVRELQHALETQFPNSSIKVYRYSNALVLTGFIDRPDYVEPIVQLAQDYAPKVINNIAVGGVQQVLLKVQIFEVSRTKLRQLGMDWAGFGPNGFIGSSVGDVIQQLATDNTLGTVNNMGGEAGDIVRFGILGDNSFFGFLRALQQHDLAKILAEPNIVAVSGRPAQFNEGGEFPIVVPQSLGTASIEFKKFGTQVDFLPIVLGNGNIRLEVRPRVSSLDRTNGIELNGANIPGLVVREVDTAVEMKAGQTFALAGLIQRRTAAVNRGWPILSDVPFFGVPFRRVQEEVNEIELLILVTPEFIDPMDPCEVPSCPPGTGTISPNNIELYCRGHLEVPNMCSECGGYPCVPTHGHEPCCPDGGLGGACGACGAYGGAGEVIIQDGAPYPMGPGMMGPTPEGVAPPPADVPIEGASGGAPTTHGELTLPPGPADYLPGASAPADRVRETEVGPDGRPLSPLSQRPATHYTATRSPRYQREGSQPFKPHGDAGSGGVGMIGPVGYDVE